MRILLVIALLLTVGCGVDAQISLGGLEEPEDGWRTDTRPYIGLDGKTSDSPGISLVAEDIDGTLFVDCTLDFVTIDWPDALLLGNGETIRTDEIFITKDDRRSSYSYEWYGSVLSKKRTVRQSAIILMALRRSLNTQEFVREFAENETLRITQRDDKATWVLTGFEDAFGKACS